MNDLRNRYQNKGKGISMNYWVVGAMFGGRKDMDQLERFIGDGCWEYGYEPGEQLVQERRFREIKVNDRIAIKRRLGKGSKQIEIRAIGIVTGIEPGKTRVSVKWLVTEMNRIVQSHGAIATIHGPFASGDPWTNQVFSI